MKPSSPPLFWFTRKHEPGEVTESPVVLGGFPQDLRLTCFRSYPTTKVIVLVGARCETRYDPGRDDIDRGRPMGWGGRGRVTRLRTDSSTC